MIGICTSIGISLVSKYEPGFHLALHSARLEGVGHHATPRALLAIGTEATAARGVHRMNALNSVTETEPLQLRCRDGKRRFGWALNEYYTTT
jgi:hypothetical protein